MSMNPQQPPVPGNIQDLKALVQQFELFLPEEKRTVIQSIIADLEANGGIRDEAHGQQLLSQLL